jgi:hypothetical protein
MDEVTELAKRNTIINIAMWVINDETFGHCHLTSYN